MKHRGPLITLIVVLGALVLMLSLNDALIPNQAAPGAAPTATDRPPGEPPGSPEAIYAGKDETGKMAVAIAIKNGKAVGYLCDGKSVEAWLTGTATGRGLTLETPDGDAEVYADLDEGGVVGIAVVGDDEFDFDIDPAEPPAGLYRKKDGTTTISWIILPDGSQVGLANANGTVKPAPALDPNAGEAEPITGETRGLRGGS